MLPALRQQKHPQTAAACMLMPEILPSQTVRRRRGDRSGAGVAAVVAGLVRQRIASHIIRQRPGRRAVAAGCVTCRVPAISQLYNVRMNPDTPPGLVSHGERAVC